MKLFILLFTGFLGFAQQTPGLKQTKSILILGAKAHIGDGTVIENSFISLLDGKIVSIGDATNLKPAKHDIVIDAVQASEVVNKLRFNHGSRIGKH